MGTAMDEVHISAADFAKVMKEMNDQYLHGTLKGVPVTFATNTTNEVVHPIAKRLRALPGAEAVFRDYSDEQLAQGYASWRQRWGGGGKDVSIAAMERGDIGFGGVIDHIPGAPAHPGGKPFITLPVETFEVRIEMTERRMREREAKDRIWVSNSILRWSERLLDRAGHTRVDKFAIEHSLSPNVTMLDRNREVVHAICHIVPFGQTYGMLPVDLHPTWDDHQKNAVRVPVPEHMKEGT